MDRMQIIEYLIQNKETQKNEPEADVENKGPENLTSHLEVQLQA